MKLFFFLEEDLDKKNKMYKFDINVYKLCLYNGYTYDIKVYSGNGKIKNKSDLDCAVFCLTDNLLHIVCYFYW